MQAEIGVGMGFGVRVHLAEPWPAPSRWRR
jgi:hypothetical protein